MAGSDFVAEILGIALRANDNAAAAGDSLGKADGTEVHALGEARGHDEPGSARALRAERVGLIDNQRRPVALAHLHQLGQRRHVAVRAVEGIDGNQPGAMHRQHPLERGRIVVAEQVRRRARAHHALVQRDVRLHVEIDGAALAGERLHEPDVGGVAGGAENRVLRLGERGEALLEAADHVALVMDPDARDGVAVTARPQRSNLAVDHVRMAGEAKVVVAAHLDVARAGGAALKRVTALPKLYLAPDMVVVDALTEELGFAGCPEFTLCRERFDYQQLETSP